MTKYRVADTPFNQHWHSDIIGQVFDEVPRPYCALEIIEGVPEVSPEEISAVYEDMEGAE